MADQSTWDFETIDRPEFQELGHTPRVSSRQDAPGPGDPAREAERHILLMEDVRSVLSKTGIKHVKGSFGSDLEVESPAANGDVKVTMGSVAMGIKEGGLVVSETLKLLYIGPRGMRFPIMQKIGSAIAANPRRLSLKDGLDHSRVTVVPVSALSGDGNPEVVMIESGGFDMKIDECVHAFPTYDKRDMYIVLELDSQKTLRSAVNPDGSSGQLCPPDSLPDLAIFFQPATTSIESDLTTFWAEKFLKQHNVPHYAVTFDGSWQDPTLKRIEEDEDIVPHRQVETNIDGNLVTQERLPINISSFLAMDASQLHANIVALKARAASKASSAKSDAPTLFHTVRSWMRSAQKMGQDVPASVLLKFILPSMIVIVTLLSVLLARFFVASPAPPAMQVWTSSSPHHIEPTLAVPSMRQVPASKSAMAPVLDTQLPTSALPATAGQKTTTEPDSGSHKPQGTLVDLIGDSHIFIRPAVATKPSQMSFEAKRDDKPIPCTLKSFDGEYYVLQIPSADAFGIVEIEVRSIGKPKLHEILEVDLGPAWLKPKHWQELARGLSERTVEEAVQLGELVQDAFLTSSLVSRFQNQSLLAHAQDGAAAILHEAERLSNWSSTIAKQQKLNPERLRKLTQLARKFRRRGSRQSAAIAKEYRKFSRHAKRISGTMSKQWSTHIKNLEKRVRDVEKKYEHRVTGQARLIRKTQKKLLQLWWSVRGRPARVR